MRAALAVAATSLLLCTPGRAVAGGPKMKVVLSPLATVGVEGSSRGLRRIEGYVGRGLERVDGVSLLSRRATLGAIRKAGRPELKVCDGDPRCLAELGELVGATYTIYGEVGGLGSAQVVYLKLVDVGHARVVRSTTLELGGEQNPVEAAREAATRLLVPGRHVGRLRISVDVKGATIFVDGVQVGRSPARPLELPVGTHALRVTHPEFRDFVRFVDVKFDKEVRVDAPMQQFSIVASDMRRTGGAIGGGGPADRGEEPVPWYKRWYTIAGAGAVVFVTSAIVAGMLADGIKADREKTVR